MEFLFSALLAGSVIDLDGTVFVQLVIFFIAFLILRSLVFKPMIALFEARENATEGARVEARKMEREAKEKADAFEEQMRKVRVAAAEERERLRQDGLQLERKVLEKVRADTQGNLAAAEARLEVEARRIREDMQSTVPRLAAQIASKLLEREVA